MILYWLSGVCMPPLDDVVVDGGVRGMFREALESGMYIFYLSSPSFRLVLPSLETEKRSRRVEERMRPL